MQRLNQWVEGFPGLLWQIELLRSRLTVLNDWRHPLLGAETARLIKDSQFRNEVVRREDLPLLGEFRDMLAGRQPAAVSFYLNEAPEQPLLLQGWPSQKAGIYCGFLKQAFLPVAYLANGIQGSCQMALNQDGYPVLLVDARTRQILASNAPAKALFSVRPEEEPVMEGIAPGEFRSHLFRAAGRALKENVWAGTLFFHAASGKPFSAKVRISPCSASEEDAVVRIALLSLDTDRAGFPLEQEMAEASGGSDAALRNGLNALAAASPFAPDGVMFSDIQSSRGRVEVYGVGACFEDMEWGARYAYEGTIAQDIERFGLSSITVDDTLDSVKSIDWVMFIPHQVRSYFAMPFYDAHGLHAVLVIASRRPGTFHAKAEKTFALLRKPFEQTLARWRAAR